MRVRARSRLTSRVQRAVVDAFLVAVAGDFDVLIAVTDPEVESMVADRRHMWCHRSEPMQVA